MFKYKIKRPPAKDLPFGQIRKIKELEYLSGFIFGQKASDIEERFARALNREKRVKEFRFREPIINSRNLPGQLEVDFIATAGASVYVFQVDGEMAHKGYGKKQDDARKDVLVNEFMKRYNAFPVKRIPGEALATQEQADQTVRELIR